MPDAARSLPGRIKRKEEAGNQTDYKRRINFERDYNMPAAAHLTGDHGTNKKFSIVVAAFDVMELASRFSEILIGPIIIEPSCRSAVYSMYEYIQVFLRIHGGQIQNKASR